MNRGSPVASGAKQEPQRKGLLKGFDGQELVRLLHLEVEEVPDSFVLIVYNVQVNGSRRDVGMASGIAHFARDRPPARAWEQKECRPQWIESSAWRSFREA